jgi:hypothetical protein
MQKNDYFFSADLAAMALAVAPPFFSLSVRLSQIS